MYAPCRKSCGFLPIVSRPSTVAVGWSAATIIFVAASCSFRLRAFAASISSENAAVKYSFSNWVRLRSDKPAVGIGCRSKGRSPYRRFSLRILSS